MLGDYRQINRAKQVARHTYSYVMAAPLYVADPRRLDTFMCTAPLHALSHNFGGRFSQFAHDYVPMAHHQYLCIKGDDGKMTCGGQDQRGKKWYDPIHGPGQPSVDDKYNPTTCKYAGSDKDVEQCVLKKFGGPRPPYGIPFGTDCQEWAEQILKECKETVKKARDLRRQAG